MKAYILNKYVQMINGIGISCSDSKYSDKADFYIAGINLLWMVLILNHGAAIDGIEILNSDNGDSL